jgi:hypothetical protein
MNWFKRLCLLPESQCATLQNIRQRILLMPAQLCHIHNRPRLAMPASGPGEAGWNYVLHQIKRLQHNIIFFYAGFRLKSFSFFFHL